MDVSSLQKEAQKLFMKYWTTYEALPVYIHPFAEELTEESSQVSEERKFMSILETLCHCLHYDDSSCSYLVLGPPGSGKTLLALQLCKMLLDPNLSFNRKPLIPLYVSLPRAVKTAKDHNSNNVNFFDLLDDYFKDHEVNLDLQILLQDLHLILVADGYDEIFVEMNFNQKNEFKDLKVRITIVVLSRELVSMFYQRSRALSCTPDADHHREFRLLPFSQHQVEDFVSRFCEFLASKSSPITNTSSICFSELSEEDVPNWTADRYLFWLAKIPDLKQLSRNPFLFFLILQLLPKIILDQGLEDSSKDEKLRLRQILESKYSIFDTFTEQWFRFQAQKILQNRGENFATVDLIGYYRSYAQNLASSLIHESGFLTEGSWSDDDCLDCAFLEPIHDEQLMKSWDEVKASVFNIRTNISLIRDGALLQLSAGRYKFMHRSIAEYFVAKHCGSHLLWIYDLHVHQENASHRMVDDDELEHKLSKFRFGRITDEGVLDQLADRTKSNSDFEKLLLQIVRKSSRDQALSIPSSNAITILNRAKVNFSGMDLRNVLIPGADLRGAVCGQTDFRGADLSGVNFSHAWLVEARFEGANLRGVNFGEEIRFQCPHKLASLSKYQDQTGNPFLIAMCRFTQGQHIHQWNLDSALPSREPLWVTQDLEDEDARFAVIEGLQAVAVWPFFMERSSYKGDRITFFELETGTPFYVIEVQKLFDLSDWRHIPNQRLTINDKWLVMFSQDTLHAVKWHGKRQWIMAVHPLPRTNPKKPDDDADDEQVQLARGNHDQLVTSSSNAAELLRIDHTHGAFERLRLISFLEATRDFPVTVAFSLDAGYVMYGHQNLELYDVMHETPVPLIGHTEAVISIAFNDQNSLVASGDMGGLIRIWDVPSGVPQTSITHMSVYVLLCFHYEEHVLVTVDFMDDLETSNIHFWKLSVPVQSHSAAGTIAKNATIGSIFGMAASVGINPIIATLHASDKVDGMLVIQKDWYCLRFWAQTNGVFKQMSMVDVGVMASKVRSLGFAGQYCVLVGLLYQNQEQPWSVQVKENKEESDFWKDVTSKAMIYSSDGLLLKTVHLQHDPWPANTNEAIQNQIYLVTLRSSVTQDGLMMATPFLDGSIQMWTMSDSFDFSKGRVLQAQYQKPSEYHRRTSLLSFFGPNIPPDYYCDSVKTLAFDATGHWVICQYTSERFTIWCIKPQWGGGNMEAIEPSYILKLEHRVRSDNWYCGMHFSGETLLLCLMDHSDIQMWAIHKSPLEDQVLMVNSIPLGCKVVAHTASFPWISTVDAEGVLRIWKQDPEFQLLQEIPLWFQFSILQFFGEDPDFIRLLVAGHYSNCVIFSLQKETCSWSLTSTVHVTKTMLMAERAQYTQAIKVFLWNKLALQGLKAIGSPAPLAQRYHSLPSLFRMLPGTALTTSGLLAGPSEIASGELMATEDVWVISVLGYVPEESRSIASAFRRFLGIRHLFLVLEGVKQSRRFAIKADLRICRTTGQNVVITLKPYTSYRGFCNDIKHCRGMQWEISAKRGQQLIEKIRQDQQQIWKYDLIDHNCITWCHHNLVSVGVPCDYQRLLWSLPAPKFHPFSSTAFVVGCFAVVLITIFLFSLFFKIKL